MAPAALALIFLALIEFTGAAVYSEKSVHQHGTHFVGYSPINASDVVGEERTVIAAAGAVMSGGALLVSMWSSVFSEKAIEIDISNLLTTSLTDPTWFMLHGYAAVLPPFVINENDPSTILQFQKTPNSGFGTEGVVSYQIGSPATLNLVIMWKMPQMSATGFFVQIKKGAKIPAEKLKDMFTNIDEKKMWFKVNNQNHWQTKKEEGLTWKAAMGTRSLASLKLVISK